MNLPNYFLADLPREAVLAPEMVREACQNLKRNRERYLAQRGTQSLIRALCEGGEAWCKSDYGIRELVLKEGPSITGFPRELLAHGLETLFSQFTPPNFQALILQDLGHPGRRDGMQP